MPKRKHTLLTIKEKNELLDKLEKGVPVVNLVAEYGIARQTISDIRRNKEKIRPKEFSIVDYDQLRSIRRKVIELQHTTGKQTSITSFFRSRTPTLSTTPVTSPEPSATNPQLPFYPGSPQPSTSGVQQPFPLLDSEEDSE